MATRFDRGRAHSPWAAPWTGCGELCSPGAAGFLHDFSCFKRLDIFTYFISAINTLFSALHHHHIISYPFHHLDRNQTPFLERGRASRRRRFVRKRDRICNRWIQVRVRDEQFFPFSSLFSIRFIAFQIDILDYVTHVNLQF